MIGKCLCGKIEFEFDAKERIAINCHCSRCRKSHGAAFASQLFSSKSSLKFIKGNDELKEYHSESGIRCFCSECGSRLMNYAHGTDNYLSIALSAIESEHEIEPVANAFVGSKARWYTPHNDIEQFEALPTNVGQYL